MLFRRSLCVCVLVLSAALTTSLASGAPYYWDPTATGGVNGGGAGTWNTASWWTGAVDATWSDGNDAYFGGGAGGAVSLTGPISAGNLVFSTSGYNISGNTLTLTGGSVAMNASSGTIGSVFAGTAGLFPSGTGTLTLNGATVNTFSGGVTINRAGLSLDFSNLAGATNLIDSSNSLTMASNGTLSVKGNAASATSQTFNGLTLNSGANVVKVASNGQATTLALNNITETAGVGASVRFTLPTSGTISTTTTDTNGIIGGWAITDSGGATGYGWAHSGTSGVNPISAAATTATLSSTANWTGTAVTVSSTVNSVLRTSGNMTFSNSGEQLTVASGGIILQGNSFWLQNATNNATTTSGGSLTTGLASGELFVHTPNAAATDIRIWATIFDNGATPTILVKDGPGFLALYQGGSNANSYTGGTIINGGELQAAYAGATGSGPVTVNSGGFLYASVANAVTGSVTLNSGGTLQPGVVGAVGSGALTINSGAELYLNTAFTFPNAITLNGGTILRWDNGAVHLSGLVTLNSGNSTIETRYDTKDLYLDGGLAGSATATLTQFSGLPPQNGFQGGTLHLTTSNSFSGMAFITGQSNVNNGASYPVSLENDGALQNATVNMGAFGLLRFSATSANPTFAALTGTAANAYIYNGTDSVPRTLTITNAASNTYAGSLGGQGGASGNMLSLTWNGPGTLTLTNTASSYTGGTTINGGVLNIAADRSLGGVPSSPTTNVTFSGNGTLQFGASNITLAANRGLAINGGTTATIDTQGFTATIAGPIADGIGGSGTLRKIGSGTLMLTGPNSYSGGTTVNSGVLNVNADTALGGAAGTVIFTNNATLQFGVNNIALGASRGIAINGGVTAAVDTNGFATETIGGVIANGSGPGSLATAGIGTLTLTGSSTYTGTTTINAGILNLNASGGNQGALGATAVSIGASGSLAALGTPTIGGTVTTTAAAANGNAQINLQNGTIDTLAIGGNLNLAANSVLSLDLGTSNGVNDQIAVAGAVSSAAGKHEVINLASPSLVSGSYTLLTAAAGGLTAGGTDFSLGSLPSARGNFALNSSTTGALVLSVTANPAPAAAYWSGAIGGNFNWNGGAGNNTNWATDATGATDTQQIPGPITNVFLTANNAVPSSGSTLTTLMDLNYSINSLTFAVSGASGITSAVVNPNGHTLTLAPGGLLLDVSSTASATIGAGSLFLAGSQNWANNNASLPLVVNANITPTNTSGPTTLTINGTGAGGVTLGGAISDNGILNPVTLVFNQAGVTQLNGSNSFSGGVTISSGTLQLGSPGALNAANPSVVNFAGGSFGTAGLRLFGNSVTVNGPYSDGTVMPVIENGGGLPATLTVNTTVANTYAGVLQDGAGLGTFGLTKAGSAALYLTGSNTYSGATNVNAGLLNFIPGALPLTAASIKFGGGTLQWSASNGNSVDVSAALAPIAAGQTALLDLGGNAVVFASSVSGTGGLTLLGNGSSLTYTLNNSYSGTTTVSAGTLQVGTGGAAGSYGSGNVFNNSVLALDRSDNVTFASDISGGGSLYEIGSGTLTNATHNIAQANINIGPSSTAAYTQTGGSTSVSGTFYLGQGAGGVGTLTLHGGTLGGGFIRTDFGVGIAFQDGGLVNINGLRLGLQSTGTGSYTVAGGTVNMSGDNVLGQLGGTGQLTLTSPGVISQAGTLYDGDQSGGIGSYTQNSGSASFGGIVMGNNAATNGSLTLHGGTLTVSGNLANYNGVGTAYQDGGLASFGAINLGNNTGGIGSYTLAGGSVSVGAVNLGTASTSGGSITVSGGSVSSTGDWVLGHNSSTGQVTLTAGVISDPNKFMYDGDQSGGFGIYTQSGGTCTFAQFQIANGAANTGSVSIVGGTLIGSLYVNAGIGTINVSQTGATPTVVLSGFIELGDASGAVATMIQTGGSVATTGDNFYVGHAAGATGSYTMDGGTMSVLADLRNDSGMGTVYQDGGLVNVGGFFRLGLNAGAIGSYTLAGGTLNINGAQTRVGEAGTGTLIIGGSNGGTMVVASADTFTVADGAGAGTLDLQAGGLLRTPNINQGAGTAAFSFSGGTLQNAVGGNLSVTMPVDLSGTGTVAIDNGQTGAFSATISDSGSLFSTGGGTLTLSGTNTYTGLTAVLNGTLIVTSPSAIEDGNNLYVGSPGAFFAPVIPASAVPTSAAIAPVPEPGSLALLAAGVAATLIVTRRGMRFGTARRR